MKALYLVGAALSICIAHFIRLYRWKLFLEVYERPDFRRLTQSLAIGYILNSVLPYKLGDVARALISGKKLKNGYALAFSTVMMDRYLDVICVGVIFSLFVVSGNDGKGIADSAKFYIAASAAALVLTAILYLFKDVLKRVVKMVAGIFNDAIEVGLLQFVWALILNFKDILKKINVLKLIVSTVGMWVVYLLSYVLYGQFLSMLGSTSSWIDVFTMLFTQNGIKASTFSIPMLDSFVDINSLLAYGFYMLFPLVIMMAVSVFFLKPSQGNTPRNSLHLLPHLNPGEKLNFLETYFSGQNRDYILNFYKINQNISIIRDYSAGSNATTMLCTDGTGTFFRKYAFGEDGDKLYQQVLWLRENTPLLKLPEILREEHNEAYCYYDMPFESGSVGLFEYAHSMPVEKSWSIIKDALESLEDSIYRQNQRPSDPGTIHAYYESKVLKNLNKIKASRRIGKLLEYRSIDINGVEYPNLQSYERYLSEEYLQKVFAKDTYATIHGDLTIENIICMRRSDGMDDFYLIDPNTGNVHDSPNLDYGKLLQSIHGGYEFLMATKVVESENNRIRFMFAKSSAYMELHSKLHQYMLTRFGAERTRSIYYHEVIHWLRLLPYKIEKNGKRALIFYAGLLMVLRDIEELYGDM